MAKILEHQHESVEGDLQRNISARQQVVDQPFFTEHFTIRGFEFGDSVREEIDPIPFFKFELCLFKGDQPSQTDQGAAARESFDLTVLSDQDW